MNKLYLFLVNIEQVLSGTFDIDKDEIIYTTYTDDFLTFENDITEIKCYLEDKYTLEKFYPRPEVFCALIKRKI